MRLIYKDKWLMLFREVIYVSRESYKAHTLCGQIAVFSNRKARGTYSSPCGLKEWNGDMHIKNLEKEQKLKSLEKEPKLNVDHTWS
jgi:hypothetical protein